MIKTYDLVHFGTIKQYKFIYQLSYDVLLSFNNSLTIVCTLRIHKQLLCHYVPASNGHHLSHICYFFVTAKITILLIVLIYEYLENQVTIHIM